MRRRLVTSTIAVVGATIVVLLVPVLLVVDTAVAPAERGGLVGRVALLALFALTTAALLAALQARNLAQPLERLARSAARVGDGDFTASPVSSGIGEIDDISRSLRLSATRVHRMLESERSFTADATHQLRTGLTGLALRLELLERHADPDVRGEVRAVLDQTHDLTHALDGLLAVARTGSTGERRAVSLLDVVTHHADDWRVAFERRRRAIVVSAAPTEPVSATPGLVGQVIDVLFDNALRHGAGALAVLVADGSVVVEDDGDGVALHEVAGLFERPADHGAAHGRGLALARRLAEADGGRLELTRRVPARFTLSYTPVAG